MRRSDVSGDLGTVAKYCVGLRLEITVVGEDDMCHCVEPEHSGDKERSE